jgi:small subunit ribosomal protein S20
MAKPHAKKAARQNLARKMSNREKLNEIRTERKKFLAALNLGKEAATSALTKVQSLLGKAVKKGRLHWKTAARLVSRMACAISKKFNSK